MQKSIINILVLLLLSGMFGCSKPPPPPPKTAGPSVKAPPPPWFKTQFQDESQFIVESIATDISEMAYFAKNKDLPDPKHFAIHATEKPNSPFRAPVYEISIVLDGKSSPLKFDLNVNGPIWSPEIYDELTKGIFDVVGIEKVPMPEPAATDTVSLANLTTLTATNIEKENQAISTLLTDDFKNPVAHEKAAMVLGAFSLREASGKFFDIRSPLCRMTAHLAFARGLTSKAANGVNGRLAEVMLLALMNDQTASLGKLTEFEQGFPELKSWVRALKARNTHDYRILENVADRSLLEKIEYFRSLCASIQPVAAFERFQKENMEEIADWNRVINCNDYSVGMGRILSESNVALELKEAGEVYQLSQGKALQKDNMVEVLNQAPDRCLKKEADGTIQVRVIGWGQWSMFCQRHVCHAVESTFNFLNNMWGVPDKAMEFRDGADLLFSGLRLYPFVRRLNSTEKAYYHKAVDDGYSVIVETPHLVSPEIWNWIQYGVPFDTRYMPISNPHINEWHHHNPPPGTAYFPVPRLNHPSLMNRPDTVSILEKLHETAPFDFFISFQLIETKYKKKATLEQAEEVYRPLKDYNPLCLDAMAETVKDKPLEYEKLMLQAATLAPVDYLILGEYLHEHGMDDKGAEYTERGKALYSDSVTVAHYSGWLVEYYKKNGHDDKSKDLANAGAEVYSFAGLLSKARSLESDKQYKEAMEFYQKIEERYNDSIPAINFCERYQETTGDKQFETDLTKRISDLFPKGVEKVSISDFHDHEVPSDGVSMNQGDEAAEKAGLKVGDVIVAFDGIRIHNWQQYRYVLWKKNDPKMNFIVWRIVKYFDLHPDVPDRNFGISFSNYPGK